MSAFFKAVELMIINLEVLTSISEVPIKKKTTTTQKMSILSYKRANDRPKVLAPVPPGVPRPKLFLSKPGSFHHPGCLFPVFTVLVFTSDGVGVGVGVGIRSVDLMI